MTIATEIIQNYRFALRCLWNAHYWKDERFRDWESFRDFEKIRAALFRGLVTRRLEPLAELAKPEQPLFGSTFQIVPGTDTGQISTMFVNMRSAEKPDNIWELVAGPFSRDQFKLTLIDFFDWNILTWRDFRYYKVKILYLQGRSELVGHEGLVEVLEADVLWNAAD